MVLHADLASHGLLHIVDLGVAGHLDGGRKFAKWLIGCYFDWVNIVLVIQLIDKIWTYLDSRAEEWLW